MINKKSSFSFQFCNNNRIILIFIRVSGVFYMFYSLTCKFDLSHSLSLSLIVNALFVVVCVFFVVFYLSRFKILSARFLLCQFSYSCSRIFAKQILVITDSKKPTRDKE